MKSYLFKRFRMAAIMTALPLVTIVALLLSGADGIKFNAAQEWLDLPQLLATLLGAAIATFTTWQFALRGEQQQDAVSVMSSATKLITLTNALFTIRQLFDQMLQSANDQNRLQEPLWLRIRPVTSVPPSVQFEPSDLRPFFRFRQSDVANEIMLLAQRHNATMDTLRLYNRIQEEHRAELQDIANSSEVSQVRALRSQELELLARHLNQNIRVDLEHAKRIRAQFNEAARAMPLSFTMALDEIHKR